MPRPKRQRKMNLPPIMLGFKPFGTPLRDLEAVNLLFEEYEAIRLADYEDLNQEEAAVKMGVSRPTFTRIYESARKTIAKALTESKVITITGGHVKFEEDWFKCRNCDETFTLHNREDDNCGNCHSDDIMKINGNEAENGEHIHRGTAYCICKNCGVEVSHKKGVPCMSINCPYCGKSLTGVKAIDVGA